MKKQTASQLLKLMKIRTLLEKTKHQAVQRSQEEKINEGSSLRKQAFESAAAGDDICPSALKHGAAYSSRLLRQAKTRRHEAAAMEETVAANHNHVRTALRCEIAAEGLFQSSLIEERKTRLEADEALRSQNLTPRKLR